MSQQPPRPGACPVCGTTLAADAWCPGCQADFLWFRDLAGNDTPCGFVMGCPLFPRMAGHHLLRRYVRQFCTGDFAACARYRLRHQGLAVDPDLLPTGDRLAGRPA